MSFLVTDPDSGVSIRYIACDDCAGTGYYEIENGWGVDTENCAKCNGTGLEELAF